MSISTSTTNERMKRLERAELAAWRDFFRSPTADTRRGCGLSLTDLDGPLVSVAAADTLALNRVSGLGLERAPVGADLDAAIATFRAAAVPRFFVQASPHAAAGGLARLLEERGFRHYNNWVKFSRDTSPPPAADTDLDVRRIDERHAAAFGRLVARNFGWPEGFDRWVAGLIGRPRWQHYLAFDGDMPVATGALFVDGDTAWLDFATTDPDYRGRGAQSALLACRIRDAAELGCDILVVETAEDRPEKPAPSYRNQLRFGFQVEYVRPNYIYYTER